MHTTFVTSRNERIVVPGRVSVIAPRVTEADDFLGIVLERRPNRKLAARLEALSDDSVRIKQLLGHGVKVRIWGTTDIGQTRVFVMRDRERYIAPDNHRLRVFVRALGPVKPVAEQEPFVMPRLRLDGKLLVSYV